LQVTETDKLRSELEQLRQATLSFTGILKQSSDPKVQEAAHVLYKQAKPKHKN